MTIEDLVRLDRAALAGLFERGEPVAVGDLTVGAWRGVALGTPAWVRRLTWTKFVKRIDRGPDGLVGHNRAVVQDGLRDPWTERRIAGRPVRYGAFTVRGTDRAWLDYGGMRDPLVRVGHGLLLGVSDLTFAGRTVRTPTWFALLPPVS